MSKPYSQGGEKGTDTNQASELFELCKEVHKRTKLPITPGMFHFDKDGYVRMRSYGHGVAYLPGNGDSPLYTSDYLLEKLQSWFSDMGANDFGQFGITILGDVYIAKVRGHDGEFSEQAAADTPLKALLKLTIALSDAGELNE